MCILSQVVAYNSARAQSFVQSRLPEQRHPVNWQTTGATAAAGDDVGMKRRHHAACRRRRNEMPPCLRVNGQ